MNKPYFEKNPILTDYTVNVTFDELLHMTMEDFNQWVIYSRKKILEAWDIYGCPPKSGRSTQEIVKEFNKLSSTDVSIFCKTDELDTIPNNVIENNIYGGTEVDQFFPNMFKVPINYTSSNNGYSVYDMFKNDKYLSSMCKRSIRHFRKDSFYHYSKCINKNDIKSAIIDTDNAIKWIEFFYENRNTTFKDYGFWIHEVETNDDISSGYTQVKQSDFLFLLSDELKELNKRYDLSHECYNPSYNNIDLNNLKSNCRYMIRLYKLNQRIYPKGFTPYRIGYISVPVNFPPMTAKYIYEKYTNHLDKSKIINIYDPSCGWGGRILGAMSVKDDRKIHYIGTDPNPDNVFTDGKTKYEHIAEFFNTKTYRGSGLFSDTNTYHIFRDGSEEISNNPEFQQYKGKIDLIFTSPPYFNREKYSDDPKQSCVKFSGSYESWRDGFLYPTLKTCFEYLKPGGYLIWNIADVLVKEGYLPLEQDSVNYLVSLGMKQEDTLKMVLASMPGAQRLDENGIPKCKNYCKIKGKYRKYEPIYVFKK